MHASTRDEIVHELGDGLMDKKSREKLLEEVERNSRDEELYDIHEMYSTEKMERDAELEEAIEKTTKEVTEKVTDEVTKKVTKEVKKQSQVDMAKKMLSKGMEVDDISDITGLTKEQIKEISF